MLTHHLEDVALEGEERSGDGYRRIDPAQEQIDGEHRNGEEVGHGLVGQTAQAVLIPKGFLGQHLFLEKKQRSHLFWGRGSILSVEKMTSEYISQKGRKVHQK